MTARLKRGSKHFEVLVEPEGLWPISRRRSKPRDILAVETIFEDANRGDRQRIDISIPLKHDPFEIAAVILKSGELQLMLSRENECLKKKEKVIYTISRNAINPQTRAPSRKEEGERWKAKVHIDPLKSVDQLVNITMKAIRPLIPIRFEEISIAVKIPPEYAPKAYGDISKIGSITKQEWQRDGSWIAVVRIPAGVQTDFYALINHLTKGEAQTKLL